MSLHLIALGVSLVVALAGCKSKKSSFVSPTEPETAVASDDVQVSPVETSNPPEAEPLPKTEEPTTRDEPVPPAGTPVPLPPPLEAPCDGTKLVIATDKLGTGPLKAQVDFNGLVLELAFTPSPRSSTLCLLGLTETTGSLLTLQILENEVVRFVAKRSNTAYKPFLTPRLVIDDCLIQRVPWDGRTHDGSCEWTITEIPAGAD